MLRFMKHVFAFFLFALSSALAQPDEYHQRALEGMAHGHNLQIEKAEEIFNDMIALEPNHPLGYLALALTNLYGHQFEENQKAFEKKFTEYTETAIKLARKNLSSQSRPVEALFHLGVGHVFWAFYHGERNNLLRALWYGKQGLDYLEQVVASDTSYYDAYLGIGVYHYYADSRRLKPFIKNGAALLGYKGDRKKGLRELQLAAEKGVYAKAEALFLLGYIFLEENENEKALDYFSALARQYPDNPYFTLALVETDKRLGNYSRAIETAHRLAEQKGDHFNPLFRAQSYHHLGDLDFASNQFETAITHYSRALEIASRSSGNANRLVAWANFDLGHCHEMLGQREEANRYYQQVKKADHKNVYEYAQRRLKQPLLPVDIELRRGWNYSLTKNYEQALAVFAEARAKATANTGDYPERKIAAIQYGIAQTQYERKAFAEAIAEFQKFFALKKIEEKGIEPRAHLYLGHCYNEIGEKQKAEAEYETALQYDNETLRLEVDKAREKYGNKLLSN